MRDVRAAWVANSEIERSIRCRKNYSLRWSGAGWLRLPKLPQLWFYRESHSALPNVLNKVTLFLPADFEMYMA